MSLVFTMLLLASCSPALNWREVTVANAPLRAHFPCRPDHSSRRVALVDHQFNVGLTSCRADGQTFAVMSINVEQSSRVAQTQFALRQMAEQNFGGDVRALVDRPVGGAKVSLSAQQVGAQMARPDRGVLRSRMIFFSQGTWVFQATVMGEAPRDEAIDFFFDSLVASKRP